ncbi:MAG: hypothetical protein P4L33_07600 [Capsulimonadaceae bacterium]|nr:hypothetical protein [Capsulimonadaceae bacterium]
MRQRRLPSVCRILSFCSCVAAAFAVAACAAAASGDTALKPVILRGFGTLTVTPRLYPATKSSWITFKAQGEAHATICGSKFIADMIGFGDVKPVKGTGLPGDVLALDGGAWWLVGQQGNLCHILCARNKSDLAALVSKAGARLWNAIPEGAYPKWLDCMDNAAVGFWFLGGGEFANDVNSDYTWYRDQSFTECTAAALDETRLVAPGVLDTTALDWYSALAKKYRVPYRQLLSWTQPRQPSAPWNYAPLPYIKPAPGFETFPDLSAEDNQPNNGFFPNPVTDPYRLDLRTRIARESGKDPYFIGHHGSPELQSTTVIDLATYAQTPSMIQAWHNYLHNTLGLSLAQVGLRYKGDASAYAKWDDVHVPLMTDFTGGDQGSLNLSGTWEGHADPSSTGTTSRWFAEGAPADWTPIASNDIVLYFANAGKLAPGYWLRRSFTLSADQVRTLRYLHTSLPSWGGSIWHPSILEMYINGQPAKWLKGTNTLDPDEDQCWDLNGVARAGGNTIAMRVVTPVSYIFLSADGRWQYPSPDKYRNQLWYDAVDFVAGYRVQWVEDNLKAIRAGEPDRPIKIMAPWNVMDKMTDDFFKYGAYPHDTGQGGDCWGPWLPLYVSWMGLPTSSEPGGPANTPGELQRMMTFYLMLGNSLVDTVFHVDEYKNKPDMNQWIVDHREMMRCIGKLDRPKSAVAVLRSLRSVRLGYEPPWSWDIARGEVQEVGRTAEYVDLPDFANGSAGYFPLVFDDGTAVFTDADIDAIERYVRAGGIFVATNSTGSDSPDQAKTWPISRLTGLSVKNSHVWKGDIQFDANENLWPSLRGQKVKGNGMAMDWLKIDHSGDALFQSDARPDVKVIARWSAIPADQGNIAVACRKIGKGMVITLGSGFWRESLDENGHWIGHTNRLGELFDALDIPRQSFVTGPNGIANEVWAEHWRSKNGVYDVYPVARINANTSKPPIDATIRMRSNDVVSQVRDLALLGHPAVAATSDRDGFALPPVTLAPMESHVYAAPRKDIEQSALYWLRTQQRQWWALQPVDAKSLYPAPETPADTLPLIENWRMSTGESGDEWTKPTFDDGKWKPVKLGSFAALGIDDSSVVSFRRTVRIPSAWSGQRVFLSFDAPTWFWGIREQGRLWINGQEMPKELTRTEKIDSFMIDVTSFARSGEITLALLVDGRLQPGRHRARASGVVGAFYLHAMPQPIQVQRLTDWKGATDINTFSPVPPTTMNGFKYLETHFTLPETWPGKRLFIESDGPIRWIAVNGRSLTIPGSMNALDISGLVNRNGDNVIRWVPDVYGSPAMTTSQRFPLTALPALSLTWLP